jgi:uncharacterized protein YoxC
LPHCATLHLFQVVTRLKSTVNAHNSRIGGLDVKANQLTVTTNTMKRSVTGLQTRTDAHDNRINGLDTNVATLSTRVGAIDTKVTGLVGTVKKVDDDAIDSYNLLVKCLTVISLVDFSPFMLH